MAAACSADDDMERARQAVRDSNTAMRDAFHSKLRADVAAGTTTVSDIAFARWMGVAVKDVNATDVAVADVQGTAAFSDTRVRICGCNVHPQYNGCTAHIVGEASSSHGRIPVTIATVPPTAGPVAMQFGVSDKGVVSIDIQAISPTVQPLVGETIRVKPGQLERVPLQGEKAHCL